MVQLLGDTDIKLNERYNNNGSMITNTFKRFSQKDLQAYIRDHTEKYDSDIGKSEPHKVIKRKRRRYSGPATHFEVQSVVGDKLSIVFDTDIPNTNVKLSDELKNKGIKLHVYEDWEPNYNRIWFKTRKEAGKALTYMTKLLKNDYAVIKVYDENC